METKALNENNQFPSPFNEDHFISVDRDFIVDLYGRFPSPFNEDHFISEASRWIEAHKREMFPSPFNEDHFISQKAIEKLFALKVGFRPLLTRIISYLCCIKTPIYQAYFLLLPAQYLDETTIRQVNSVQFSDISNANIGTCLILPLPYLSHQL